MISEIVKEAEPLPAMTPTSSTSPGGNDAHKEMSTFQQNLLEIQRAASQLVSLQQNIKLSGRLTDTDRRLYSENLEKLGVSAQNLAHIQQAGGQDDFRLLFEGPLFGNERGDSDGEDVEAVPGVEDGAAEEMVGEESSGGAASGAESANKPSAGGDSVQVSVPDKEASVAEAKPVGESLEYVLNSR